MQVRYKSDVPAIQSRVQLVKVPGYPSTSCGPEAMSTKVGIVVGADSRTFSVRMDDRSIVVISMENGTQIQTEAQQNRGSSPWFWPPRAILAQHMGMEKTARKYRESIEQMHKDLGTYQRRIEAFGKLITNEP
jgi:hypothetical protein